MTRIVSYNILAGGYSAQEYGIQRLDQLTKVIRSAQPDIVGLPEGINLRVTKRPLVIEEIAETLGMQLITTGDTGESGYRNGYLPALLTSLPVIHTQIHNRPGLLTRPLLEVCVKEAHGDHLTVFVMHLSAAFHRGRGGDHIRQREVREILSITAPLREQGVPHLLMGDFNSLAPGDPFQASNLLRYMINLDRRKHNPGFIDGQPYLSSLVPRQLRFLNPLLRSIAENNLLCALFDTAASFYVPRGTIRLVYQAHYVDCYRRSHPNERGFTCPAASPAGRIDFIFASPTLLERLETCDPVTEAEGLPGSQASDHLAVTAEFGIRIQPEVLSTGVRNAITK